MLTTNQFVNAAKKLNVSAAAVQAFAAVESQGSGFLPNGTPKILFERHVMYQRLAKKFGAQVANERASAFPDLVNKNAGGYGPASSQHARLDLAAKIDRECALESASWGAFQIMGYHWKALGYASVQDFVNAMYSGEEAQLDAFVRFILLTPALVDALRASDWAKVARLYNGPDYKKNNYDAKLNQEFIKAGGK